LVACANADRPSDHAEFARKWINSVSHLDDNSLNCQIAQEWVEGGLGDCREVFDYVQQQYLGSVEFHRQAGGSTEAVELKNVTFDCRVDESEGTMKDHDRWGTKLPVNCVDKDGLGVTVLLANFAGPSADYSVYQVEGYSRHFD